MSKLCFQWDYGDSEFCLFQGLGSGQAEIQTSDPDELSKWLVKQYKGSEAECGIWLDADMPEEALVFAVRALKRMPKQIKRKDELETISVHWGTP